jgi:hypothetical protein
MHSAAFRPIPNFNISVIGKTYNNGVSCLVNVIDAAANADRS